MNNIPTVKIGVVAVSRDCFPESLSVDRRKALMSAFNAKYGMEAESVYECPVCIVESEIHMTEALEDIKKNGCNALVVYLGNFGRRSPRPFWPSTSTAPACSSPPPRSPATTLWAAAATRTAVCSTPAIT